jgi:hypothetical protein
MHTENNILSRFSSSSRLALALAFAVCLFSATHAEDQPAGMGPMGDMPPKAMPAGGMTGMDMKGKPHPLDMGQIKTQADAEALKPGDSISMACGKCKSVMVMTVTSDTEHVKMMTVGEKSVCDACGGAVEVVGTGKGEGKNQEVKHVCSKCGDDAMFVCASKAGSGAMKGMDMK